MAERGRHRGFDRSAVLDLALNVFWQNGFEATSMIDLVAAMGINSPSIYAAYGSKEELFMEAIKHYQEHYARGIRDALDCAADAVSGLSAMFETAIDVFTRADGPKGCFVLLAEAGNGPSSVASRDMLSSLRQQRSAEIAARLQRDIDERRARLDLPVEALADMYAALLHGIAVAARYGAPRSRLVALYKPALLLVGSEHFYSIAR